MIEKILDNYYSNKLILFIRHVLRFIDIDIKVEKIDKKIKILIKEKGYNDFQYKVLFEFYKEDSFEFMCRNEILRDYINDKAMEVLDNERNQA